MHDHEQPETELTPKQIALQRLRARPVPSILETEAIFDQAREEMDQLGIVLDTTFDRMLKNRARTGNYAFEKIIPAENIEVAHGHVPSYPFAATLKKIEAMHVLMPNYVITDNETADLLDK